MPLWAAARSIGFWPWRKCRRRYIVGQPLRKLLRLLEEMDIGLTQLELCFKHIHVPLPFKDASILLILRCHRRGISTS